MSKKVDILNKRFGRWTVISESNERSIHKQVYWLCRCDCGTEKLILYGSLVNKNSRSCGCLKIAELIKRSVKHRKTGTKEYRSWQSMKRRCYSKSNNKYKDYGGRGILICDRWKKSFECFIDDMGECPSKEHSLDRIDVNGNYEPLNCRWATHLQQAANRTNNHWIKFKEENKIMQDWARDLHVSHGNFIRMIKRVGVEQTIMFYNNKKNEYSV